MISDVLQKNLKMNKIFLTIIMAMVSIVKWGLLNAVYKQPLSLEELHSDYTGQYKYMAYDKDLYCSLYSYPGDPRVSLLFDCCGNIAGVRTGYIKTDVTKRAEENNVTFDLSYYEDKPMFISGSYWGYELWYNTVLFVSPNLLKACVNNTNCPENSDVWLNLDGVWTNISHSECDIESLGFVKQACFIGMGQHYYYKTCNETVCKDIPGVFMLYERCKHIGVGLIPFGTFKGAWFEDPPKWVDEAIVPNRPSCMSTWLTNYGMTGMHMMFKRHPRMSLCTWPWQYTCSCDTD